MNNDPLLLDVVGASETLGVSTRTLWRLTAPRGPLPCVRIGRSVRYAVDDLRAYIDQQRRETVARVARETGTMTAAEMPEVRTDA